LTARIAVFGLGYVGSVSAACLAERGNEVIGVDVSPEKVAMINAGRAPVYEERIGELTEDVVAAGRLRATTDAKEAIAASDLALVCVGTPSSASGGLSTKHLEHVAGEIGCGIADLDRRYTVVIRSTMLPGTCEEIVIPRLEEGSQRRAGADFGVCVNPEFLREGTSVRDFYDPPKTVVGELEPRGGELVASLYEGLPGPVYRVPLRVAEMTKYVDNAFHALKVGFANEIGRLCKALSLDSHRVMEIFVADTKLNISPAYLRPGFAFGGSCLPKDLRALLYAARHADVEVPILERVLDSNEAQIARVFDLVMGAGVQRVGLFGLSFKAGTDDLRESPMVSLAERLLGRGLELLIYDNEVAVSRLRGANRAYVEERIPHLSRLMASSADAVATHAEVCILGSSDPAALGAIERRGDGLIVIDLVRPAGVDAVSERPGYIGINW
jgi:GDP-mannose 6-dehydrogenase